MPPPDQQPRLSPPRSPQPPMHAPGPAAPAPSSEHRPTPSTRALLAHLHSEYARLRAYPLPPAEAARRAAAAPILPDHHPSPHSPNSPNRPASQNQVRKELALLDNRHKMSACQSIFMSSYKRSKTQKLHTAIRALFENQYAPTRRPTANSAAAAPAPAHPRCRHTTTNTSPFSNSNCQHNCNNNNCHNINTNNTNNNINSRTNNNNPFTAPSSPPAPTAPKKKKKNELLGCQHYARNCKLKAACCGLYVTCRFCHDEAMADDHEMDRFATETVLCMVCLTEQSVGPRCTTCHTSFAHYFCKECRFYENTPGKKVYHCHRCNICRLGEGLGIDNYHCDNCDACVALESKSMHRCLSNALHANCPVCRGYLFTSTEPVVFMRCGHTMHSRCFDDYTTSSYQCPLCMRSLTNMDKYFAEIDEHIRSEPMPPEYQHKRSLILCNDCGQKCVAKYHFLYHKCSNEECKSYNTKVLDVFEVEPFSPSGEQQQHQASQPPQLQRMVLPQQNAPPVNDAIAGLDGTGMVEALSSAGTSSTGLTMGSHGEPGGYFPFADAAFAGSGLDGADELPGADEGQFARSPVQGTVRG